MAETRSRERGPLSNIRIVLGAAPGRRIHLFATLALTLAGAFAELVTIGAVLPLLAIAASPSSVGAMPVLGPVLETIGSALQVSPMLAASALLAVSAVGATIIRFLLTWVSQQFVYGLQQDLIMTVFGRALRQPYSWYVRQNSSVLLSGVEKISLVIAGMFAPLVTDRPPASGLR